MLTLALKKAICSSPQGGATLKKGNTNETEKHACYAMGLNVVSKTCDFDCILYGLVENRI